MSFPGIAQFAAHKLVSCPGEPMAGTTNDAADTGRVVPSGQVTTAAPPPVVDEPEDEEEPAPTGGGKPGAPLG